MFAMPATVVPASCCRRLYRDSLYSVTAKSSLRSHLVLNCPTTMGIHGSLIPLCLCFTYSPTSLPGIFFFFEVLVIPNQPQTHYIANGDFELLIFLPLISPDPRLQACATVLGLCSAVDLVQDFVHLSYVLHPHALDFSIFGLINGPSLVSFTGQSYWLISLVSWKCFPPIGFSLPVPEIPPCDLVMMLSLV